MSKLRIVFMGTPDFAVSSLKKIEESSFNVVGVITSQDKQAGRGLNIQQSPVKRFALKNNLHVLQPKNLKDPVFIDQLKTLNANMFVVVAFRMLPEIIWKMPEFGTINLHASLLPQYRGAAPINWAIINGEKTTGVTSFFIEKEIDTGNIIMQKKVDIMPEETAGELHDKLMITGANLLAETIQIIEDKTFKTTTQTELFNQSYDIKKAPKIHKEDCKIDWNKDANEIYNFIRGLSPYPCAWTELTSSNKKLTLKIFLSEMIKKEHNYVPATIISDNKKFIRVASKSGFIEISELQLEGKKRMKTHEFLRGFNIENYSVM